MQCNLFWQILLRNFEKFNFHLGQQCGNNESEINCSNGYKTKAGNRRSIENDQRTLLTLRDYSSLEAGSGVSEAHGNGLMSNGLKVRKSATAEVKTAGTTGHIMWSRCFD